MSGLVKGHLDITPHESDDGKGGVVRNSDVTAQVNDNQPESAIKLGLLLGADHEMKEFKINGVDMWPRKHSGAVEAELNKAYPPPKIQKWIGFYIQREYLPPPNEQFETVLHLTNRHKDDEPIRWVVAYHDKVFDKDSCDGPSTIRPR